MDVGPELDTADEQALAAWLADPTTQKVVHEVKGPYLAIWARGWELEGVVSDARKQFDAIWVSPPVGDPLEVGLRHAASADDALAEIFALAVPADVAAVWIGGDQVKGA